MLLLIFQNILIGLFSLKWLNEWKDKWINEWMNDEGNDEGNDELIY